MSIKVTKILRIFFQKFCEFQPWFQKWSNTDNLPFFNVHSNLLNKQTLH
jgi:hypothetical protein